MQYTSATCSKNPAMQNLLETNQLESHHVAPLESHRSRRSGFHAPVQALLCINAKDCLEASCSAVSRA